MEENRFKKGDKVLVRFGMKLKSCTIIRFHNGLKMYEVSYKYYDGLHRLFQYKKNYVRSNRISSNMKTNKIIIGNKEIEYLDVVYHCTTTRFSFWDRIKILLGKPVIVDSEIYTLNEEVVILGSQSKSYVPVLIPKKQKGFMISDEQINSQA